MLRSSKAKQQKSQKEKMEGRNYKRNHLKMFPRVNTGETGECTESWVTGTALWEGTTAGIDARAGEPAL